VEAQHTLGESECYGGRRWEAVGVVKDKEAELEDVEAPHTLQGVSGFTGTRCIASGPQMIVDRSYVKKVSFFQH
jgi:hypothetical protein